MRVILISALLSIPFCAHAGVCDFRPSIVAGKVGQTAKDAASNVSSAAVNSARAVGAYTLKNPATGLSMISSGVSGATAVGSSVAGSASGTLSTATAVVTAPATIAIAGVSAVALGAFEGTCYFRAKRITDDAVILEIVSNLSENADPTMFALIPEGSEFTTLKGEPAIAREHKVRIAGPGVGPFIFDVADLYIVDGVLKHSDALRDTVIGNVALEVIEIDD